MKIKNLRIYQRFIVKFKIYIDNPKVRIAYASAFGCFFAGFLFLAK